MQTFLRSLSQLGGGPGFPENCSKLLLKTLDTDEANLDRELREYIGTLKPRWNEEFRSLETAGESWFQIGFPKTNAAAWQSAKLPKSFSVSGVVTIHPGTKTQCNLRLGKRGSFTQLSLTAGYGLNVFRFAEKEWENMDRKKLQIDIGTPVKFELEYDREIETLSLKLDQKIAYLKRMKLPDSLQLGLGVQNGAVAEWQKFIVAEK